MVCPRAWVENDSGGVMTECASPKTTMASGLPIRYLDLWVDRATSKVRYGGKRTTAVSFALVLDSSDLKKADHP